MATSPPYSFVQFGNPAPDDCCNGINAICLPVVNTDDLYFQVIGGGTLEVVRMDGTVVSSQSGFVTTGTSDSWQGSIDLGDLLDGECFQLRIGSDLSNCFQRRFDDCFTTLLEYTNTTDYGQFIYCDVDFVNRVRVPMFLSKPKLPEDRGIYRQSNGMYKITKSVITKEYQVQTDYMPQFLHEALIVAMAHDSIYVSGSQYTGYITKSGEYNQPWDDDACVVQADFKVMASPFEVRYNNCQTCDPVIIVPPPPTCIPVTITGTTAPILPYGAVGIPFSYDIAFTGDAPYAMSGAEITPSWMVVTIVGNNIHLSGTPDAPGLGQAVQLWITNCATDSAFINTLIHVS